MDRILIEEDLDDMVLSQAGGILSGLYDEVVVGKPTETESINTYFYRQPKEPKPALPEHIVVAVRKVGRIKAIVNREIKKYHGMTQYKDETYKLYFIRNPNAQPRDLWEYIKKQYVAKHSK